MSQHNCRPFRPDTFDLARSPLAGLNLIDASAGTGKTYTICGLVLRLILEKRLAIEQILVVTYTEAATEDLRDRIRKKLRQALEAISDQPVDDPFLQDYLAGIQDHRKAAMLLSEALRSFDEAAIFTIHGFCQKMLLENSFESDTLFDTELIADDSYIYKEIIEDFWRLNISRGSTLFSQFAADRLSPDELHNFLRPLIPHPFLQFLPDLDFALDCSGLEDNENVYTEAYRAVCREWVAARPDVSRQLLQSRGLNRNIYRLESMPALISRMDHMAAECFPSMDLFEKFQLLTSRKIESGTKSKETPSLLPFYELCEDLDRVRGNLVVQYERCLLALKKRLLDSFRHELRLRKARDNVFSFDDLLFRLHEAVSKPRDDTLSQAIARKYPAALIDEFQDTDPLQFEIFKAIYQDDPLLYLIGDPKQAIYSFRGADVFTYMEASAGSSLAHYTLGINYRSTPELVKAVNAIFCRSAKSFVFDAISFNPVLPAEKQDREYLTIDGERKEPFMLWLLGRDQNTIGTVPSHTKNPRISKSTAQKIAISQVAAEIRRLLHLAAENRVNINGRKLLPGDMAVLVRKNEEARKIQQSLTALQVPSVLHSGDNLFVTAEAKDMSLLLQAIIMPNNIRLVKTALLTRFFDRQANLIHRLQESGPASETLIEYWLTKFRRYHELWDRFGFIRMFWTAIRENRVRQRLLASENGERSLTNILHLAEILHRESVSQGLNMTALLGYLHESLADDLSKNIEYQLRLESDEDRVKIVTIHKAKGLEYPVVFCPFTWEGLRTDAKRGCLFHRQKVDHKTTLLFDAGSHDLEKHLLQAQEEEMAENLRLLYVALTRAVHRCYLVWGPINGAQTSAPAYLLHQGNQEDREGPHQSPESVMTRIQKAANRFQGLSDNEILADLQGLAAASEGTIKVSSIAEPPGVPLLKKEEISLELRCRKFSGTLPHDWHINSFSSLIAGAAAVIDGGRLPEKEIVDPDETPAVRDTHAEQPEQGESPFDIFSFPQGTRPGTFLHELLEQADFSSKSPVEEQIVFEKLRYFGYETNWYPAIREMLENLGTLSLHNDIQGLNLASIPRSNCLHELEFYFPLSRLTPGALKDIFSRKILPGSALKTEILLDRQLDRLTFSPSRGFMRGFIDLVFSFGGRFYLVDWKSNYLGPGIENYHRDKLTESVLSGFYFLQYHIYCLALHLYLGKRLPGYQYAKQFGGVFYLYLRGINQDLGPAYGIYYDRPDTELMDIFRETLLAGKPSAGENESRNEIYE